MHLICCKLSGHPGKHECPYDHKCKEKCQFCLISTCNVDGCTGDCQKETCHPDEHTCKHFHKCLHNCEYYDNCKKGCILSCEHKGNHRCDIPIHICTDDCEYKNKARK